MRFTDVAAPFIASDSLTQALLDLINQSMRRILEGYDWHFDHRHDGVIETIPEVTTGTGFTITNGSRAGGCLTYTAGSTVSGNFKLRLIGTDDSNFGDTSFGVRDASLSGTTLSFNLDNTWPGTTTALSGKVETFVAEYGLPTTVRSVLRAWHQENDLFIEAIAPEEQFERRFPRWHETRSTQPEVMAIGGLIDPTYATNATATDSMLRCILFPAPSSTLTIGYSYIHRHATLEAATDELSGVDEAVVDAIIRDAYAEACFTAIANDPERGIRIKQDVAAHILMLRNGLKPDPHRRNRLHAIDRKKSIGDQFGTLPNGGRNFGSLP